MGLGGIGGGAKCAKILLFVFNFIFWLCGAALLGLGIWAYIDDSSLTEKMSHILNVAELSGSSLRSTAILFMVVGAFIFLIGFCGCWGAIKDVRCLLGVYIILLVVIIVCEIVAGVLAVVYRGKVEDQLRSTGRSYLGSGYYNTSIPSDQDLAWNYVMQEFKCCGMDGPNDFHGNAHVTNATTYVSQFCCVPADGKPATRSIQPKDAARCQTDIRGCLSNSNTTCVNSEEYVYHEGCYSALLDFVKDNYLIFIVIALVIAVVEVVGLLFAVCLCRALGREKEHY